MSKSVAISDMSKEIIKGLNEYANLANDEMKQSVKKVSRDVKDEIKQNAPTKTGAYRDSWAVKKLGENASTLQMVVYSKNRYQLAHLLENGHAKRGGGRVSGKAHIAPAEQKGVKKLLQEIEKRF